MVKFKHLYLIPFLLLLLSLERYRDVSYCRALKNLEEKNYRRALEYISKTDPKEKIVPYVTCKIYFHLHSYTNVILTAENIRTGHELLDDLSRLYLALSWQALDEPDKSLKILDRITGQEKVLKTLKAGIRAEGYLKLCRTGAASSNLLYSLGNAASLDYYNHQVKQEFLGPEFEQNAFRKLFDIYYQGNDLDNLFYLFRTFYPVYIRKNKAYYLSQTVKLLEKKKLLPGRKDLLLLARELYQIGQKSQARDYLENILSGATNDTVMIQALFYMALVNKENPGKARPYLDRLSGFPSDQEEALYYRARGTYLLADFSNSEEMYKKIILTCSDKNRVRDAYYDLTAGIYTKLDKKKEYRDLLKEFYDKFPSSRSSSDLYFRSGLDFLHQGEPDRAQAVFRALLSNPYHGQASEYLLARILRENGEEEKALDLFLHLMDRSELNYYFVQTVRQIRTFTNKALVIEKIKSRKNEPLMYNLLQYLIAGEKQYSKDLQDLMEKHYSFQNLVFGDKGIQVFDNEKINLYNYLIYNRLFLEAHLVYRDLIRNVDKNYRNKIYMKLLALSVEDNYFPDSLNFRINLIYNHGLSPYLAGLDKEYIRYYYPLHFKKIIMKNIRKVNPDLPVSLVFSLVREESRYDLAALSPAQAMGLFQLMYNTAEPVFRKIRKSRDQTLFHPDINSYIGLTYLDQTFREFRNPILVLCAYNAGTGRTRTWLKTIPYRDKYPEIFIEQIPYSETRNYVKKILTSLYFYELQE
ncbi:MAG: transglycosylase SLT domain-containing protein [bacterium]|nr:transglycosylase SLT domain-containing protein [bacterium]